MHAFREMKIEISDFFHSNKITTAILWLITAFFPVYITLVANYISFGSGEQLALLLTENTGSFFFGLLLVVFVFLAMIMLLPSIAGAAFLTSLLGILLPLVDFFKHSILKEHFLPWDIYLAQNAGSFTEFVSALVIPHGHIEVIISTLFYCALLYFMVPQLPFQWKRRAPLAPLFVIVLCLFVANDGLRKNVYGFFDISTEEVPDQEALYQSHGFLTAFALNFGSLNIAEPQNYSIGYMHHAFEKYLPNATEENDFANPDIVVVLSESFWDPTLLEGVTFSDDPLENFREIAKTHPSGKMVSPTFGGGTVRPEFEILTGLSTSALPTGNIPYQQYLKKDLLTYPRLYKNMGYDTVGVHTYQKNFYDRDKAYPLMGFDAFLGEYDLNTEHHWNSGPYITDETIAEEIIYQLEQPHETGVFVMAITMENHSLYHEKYDKRDRTIQVSGDGLSERQLQALENFAVGVSHSDQCLKTIYDFVMSREKPTVVLWYGDHLPTLGDSFAPYTTTGTISTALAADWSDEEKYMMFSTPYLIFTNYDTGNEYLADGEHVSPYLLPALMADYIGAPESIQTNFLLDLYHTSPVISKYYALYTPDTNETKREEMRILHELMTYDLLIGNGYIAQMN